MRIEEAKYTPQTWTVHVDAGELVVASGKAVPYPFCVGTFNAKGKINVWTPARGVRAARLQGGGPGAPRARRGREGVPMNLTRGKLYLLKGGHVMRYHGAWGSTERDGFRATKPGHCGAYQAPSAELSDVAVGYSAGADEVIRELGPADLVWLDERFAQLMARNMEAEATEIRIAANEIVGIPDAKE